MEAMGIKMQFHKWHIKLLETFGLFSTEMIASATKKNSLIHKRLCFRNIISVILL